MTPQRKNDFSQGSIAKNILSLAIPLTVAQLTVVLYNVVDRAFIGHIDAVGRDAFTGIGLVMPATYIITAFANLCGTGGAPLFSIARGQGRDRRAARIMGVSFTLLLLLGAVLTIGFYLFQTPFLYLVGGSAETVVHARDYLQIYLIGVIPVMIGLGMNPFINAQGFGKVGMTTTLLGAVINLILDPIFIFVLHMGVQGAALATIISQAVSAIWVLRFLLGPKTKWRLRKENLRPQAKVVLPCLALGLSPFIMQSTESLIAVCFNSSLLKYGGDIAVGAMTVLTSIMQFAMMPLQGLTQGAQPIISYNFGARNAQRVRDAFRCLLRACLVYSITLWALVHLFPEMFVLIFFFFSALVQYGAWALQIYMGATCIFGIQIACQQTFIALGNAKTSLFLAVLRKIILLIPLIYILPNFFTDKTFAVFLAEPVADLLAVCTTGVMFFFQFRRSMGELEAKAA